MIRVKNNHHFLDHCSDTKLHSLLDNAPKYLVGYVIQKRWSDFFSHHTWLKPDYCALINQIVIWLFCKQQTQQCFANCHLPARQIHFISLLPFLVHTLIQYNILGGKFHFYIFAHKANAGRGWHKISWG